MKDLRFLLFATSGALLIIGAGFAIQRYRAENVLVTRVEILEIQGAGLSSMPGQKSSVRRWTWRGERARVVLEKYVIDKSVRNGFQRLYRNGYEIETFSNRGRLWRRELRLSMLTAASETYFLKILQPR